MKTVQIVCFLCCIVYLSAGVLAYDFCHKNCGPKQHVLCGITKCEETFCEENEPDYEWRMNILTNHNLIRSRIAGGMERRYGHTEASNMMAMSYDLNLEAIAGCSLYRYGLDRYRCINTPKFYLVGVNMLTSTVLDPCTEHTIKAAIDIWYEEIEYTSQEIIDEYPVRRILRTNYSHFTQMIWASTTHVGCARCRKDDTFMMMCLYGPAGNIPTYQVYQRGPTASQCPEEPNDHFPELCGKFVMPNNATQPGLHMNLVNLPRNRGSPLSFSLVCAITATFVRRMF